MRVKSQRLVIPRRAENLNDLLQLKSSGGGRGLGSPMNRRKKEWHDLIRACVIDQQIKPVSPPVVVLLAMYESNRRRDPDNIASATLKVALDGLQHAGILPGDGWETIDGIVCSWFVDKENPRIEINLQEVIE